MRNAWRTPQRFARPRTSRHSSLATEAKRPMDFYTGLLNLTNWSGNVILPTLAGLLFSFAVVCFSKGRDYHQWMYGGFLALMASGLLRMMEIFTSQLTWDNPDLFWNALLN